MYWFFLFLIHVGGGSALSRQQLLGGEDNMDSKEITINPYLRKDISDLLPPAPAYYYQKRLSKREKIKRLRRSLEAGKIMGPALRDAYLSSFMLHHWKKECNCDRLWKLICAARERGQEVRNDIVEDAHFRRLASGVASGSEYEFYLTNRRTDRWKKINEFGSTQGAPVLLKPPVINYISVSVNQGKTEVENGNGNGNRRHIEHV